MHESVRERFEAKYLAEPMSGCWLWEGHLSDQGYGILSVTEDGKQRGHKAHRVSWRLYRGEIQNGLEVCHRCDNPACVNPDHLFLGTHLENMLDAAKKGRLKWGPDKKYAGPWGETHPQAKLTALDVEVIRASRLMHKTLASIFGVSRPLITKIKGGNRRRMTAPA